MTARDARDWTRLAHKAIARRAELGDPTITKIVDNAGTWRGLTAWTEDDPDKRAKARRLGNQTLRQLERGLGWGVRAADAVLAGGEPWLIDDDPELPDDAEGIWAVFPGGEVRAILPDDPAKRARVASFIRRHVELLDSGD